MSKFDLSSGNFIKKSDRSHALSTNDIIKQAESCQCIVVQYPSGDPNSTIIIMNMVEHPELHEMWLIPRKEDPIAKNTRTSDGCDNMGLVLSLDGKLYPIIGSEMWESIAGGSKFVMLLLRTQERGPDKPMNDEYTWIDLKRLEI